MKNLSLLLGLLTLLAVTQESVAYAGQAMQPLVAQPPLRADCTPAQVAFKICRAPEAVVGGKQPATTQAAGQSQKQPVVAFPAAPAVVAPVVPQEFVPCQGVAKTTIDYPENMRNAAQLVKADLDRVLNNLNVPLINGRYQFCFNMPNQQPIAEHVSFNRQLDHEVIISGLKLTKAANFQEPLLDISSQQPVTIIDSTFTNVTNGIRLSGAPHMLDHVAVSGDANNMTGACVLINSEGVILSETQVSNCGSGVKVGANYFTFSNNSKAFSNNYGLYIDDGIVDTRVTSGSYSYGNSDLQRATSSGQDAIFHVNGARGVPFKYYSVSNDGLQIQELDPLQPIEVDDGKKIIIAPNEDNHSDNLHVVVTVADNQMCGLPVDLNLFGQGCTAFGQVVDYEVGSHLEVPLGMADQYNDKQITLMASDDRGVYSLSPAITKKRYSIVALGGVNPIIVPAPVAAAGGEAAPADPLSGSAAEGEPEEEVQVAFGGPNGADVGGPDFGPGGDLGGGNMGGAGGSAGDEVISAKDGAAESNSGHSGDKVAFGGDSDAVKIADSGFVTGGASGASGGCSLNPKTSSAPLTGILFIGTLLLAKTRRKFQKI